MARVRAARLVLRDQREGEGAWASTSSWDCEHAKTPDGYYQVRGGIDYAIAKSLAVAPYADVLWMETKTADLHDAKIFADAIHARFPDTMLAYNLSPSFNWDTTGMTDEQMRRFPEELGKLGFVFNFITYGGHQIDGLAGEEFATALRQDGMLALARLQRKFRLLESPYRTPQTLVGGPRADAALMSLSGRTSTTKAMGKGSTQFQHQVQTEVPPKVLEEWLDIWRKRHGIERQAHGRRCGRTAPARSCSSSASSTPTARRPRTSIFEPIQDRQRPQHPLDPRPEHVRREAPAEAPHDAEPALPDPPLQGRLGALPHADRGQPAADREA